MCFLILQSSFQNDFIMAVINRGFEITTNGEFEIIDITGQIIRLVQTCTLKDGIVNIFIPGVEIGITTIECEAGKIGNIPEKFKKLSLFGNDPGDSQLKVAIVGTSITFPFVRTNLLLETWQQIVLIDFSNESKTRRITVQLIGE
jgi:secondary thiamine-phosphate synthase enzyme